MLPVSISIKSIKIFTYRFVIFLLLLLLLLLVFAVDAAVVAVTAMTKGLLNLRGSDFDYAPLFFAYVIIVEHDTYLYLLKQERATTNKIDNHFQTEHIDVIINEYNNTVTGINSVVSNFTTKTTDHKMKREKKYLKKICEND